GSVSLMTGKDRNKVQSYFLCQVTQDQLKKAVFPLGELQKPEVRKIAKEQDLITGDKKDSQGLCFIGKVRLTEFLQEMLRDKEGKVIEIPNDFPALVQQRESPRDFSHISELAAPVHFSESDGMEVARHQGAHFYTIGQRRGLNIGGRPNPSYVLQTNTKNNLVFSGQTHDHLGLNRYALKIDNNTITFTNSKNKFKNNTITTVLAQIRYRQPPQKARVLQQEHKTYVLFDELQRGIAPGQFCAFYNFEDELLGAGVIE